MSSELVPIPSRDLARAGLDRLPAAIGRAGEAAAWRFIEFFVATIRNRNTRAAYAEAVGQFFAWCELHRVRTLEQISPIVIATYIENHPGAAPTVKQHLAAIRMLFDFLVTGQIVPSFVRSTAASKAFALSPPNVHHLVRSLLASVLTTLPPDLATVVSERADRISATARLDQTASILSSTRRSRTEALFAPVKLRNNVCGVLNTPNVVELNIRFDRGTASRRYYRESVEASLVIHARTSFGFPMVADKPILCG